MQGQTVSGCSNPNSYVDMDVFQGTPLTFQSTMVISGVTSDTTPPMPNPSTWATAPYATGPNSIQMVATAASDPSGVQYYFQCLTTGGHDSGWQSSPTYQDTGLSPSTSYTYRVKTRDQSANQNTGSYSTTSSATTQPSGNPHLQLPASARSSEQTPHRSSRLAARTSSASRPLTLTWPGQTGYTVPPANVTYVNNTQLQMSITTGTEPYHWTVQAINPDNQPSNVKSFQVNAPVPIINGISPTSASAGSGDIILTVNGTTFQALPLCRPTEIIWIPPQTAIPPVLQPS